MNNTLIVPITLNALVPNTELTVCGPQADFSRSPYSKDGVDYNPGTANVSTEILAAPFQNRNFILQPGVHLHWILPSLLSGEIPAELRTQDGFNFPSVPNRWLIVKSLALPEEAPMEVNKWVVESDYLHPTNLNQEPYAATIPYPGTADEPQPYRYLGVTTLLDDWSPQNGDALRPFTAAGYGTPAFNAFYPNCHSAFGFFDTDIDSQMGENEYTYEVFGVYSDSADDYLVQLLAVFEQTTGITADAAGFGAWLQDNFSLDYNTSGGVPHQMICYGKISIVPRAFDTIPATETDLNATVVIGNTGTEAVSAYLGTHLQPDSPLVAEDQLEAIQLKQNLEHRTVDIGAKFQEARHSKEFYGSAGGKLWTVVPDKTDTSGDSSQWNLQMTLDDDLAHELNALNELQQTYDQAGFELDTLREQLFADWHKYMVNCYPPEGNLDQYFDIDEVRYFVEHKTKNRLAKLEGLRGEVTLFTDPNTELITAADYGTSRAGSLARTLTSAINELLDAIGAQNAELDGNDDTQTPRVALKVVPADRYWQPSEPVVLVVGESAESDSLPLPGTVQSCVLLPALTDDYTTATEKGTFETLIRAVQTAGGNNLPSRTASTQPWNPIRLEWEVELFPKAVGRSAEEASGAFRNQYSTDYIAQNYQLSPDAVDLEAPHESYLKEKGANLYTGSSFLSPGAIQVQQNALYSFLRTQIQQGVITDPRTAPFDDTEPFTLAEADRLDSTYEQATFSASTTEEERNADAIYTALQAYRTLLPQETQMISQALSGFNAALRMKKQTFQLMITDPLGFADAEAFSNSVVADYVGTFNRMAPEPLLDFNPIRTGELNLSQLRLVDTFGRTRELDASNPTVAHKLYNENSRFPVTLPPRLVQEARLDFRWLSGNPAHDDLEMNAHPATSPVCGWMLPNNLDNSLVFYDADGAVQGQLYAETSSQDATQARWNQPPGGRSGVAFVKDIANPHLRQVVTRIQAGGSTFVNDFLTTVDTALDNIEPDSSAQHQSLAVLMGRPLAIVRAAVQMSLKGQPAIEESWDALIADMGRQSRETNRFENVQWPVRIGEYRQLNDGVAGFWVESAGEISPTAAFYAPQTSGSANADNIVYHSDAEASLYLAPGDDPTVLSLLVDPRGSLHATSGVLPTRELSIPADQYAAALEKIGITFLSMPLLTPASSVQISLPQEDGYQWSWIERDAQTWTEVGTVGVVTQAQVTAAFAEGAQLWTDLQAANWITLVDDDSATVTPRDQRTGTTLDNFSTDQLPAIERFLAQTHLGAMSADGKFQGAQTIREGWIKLKPLTELATIDSNESFSN